MGDCSDPLLEGVRITDEGYLWTELIPKYYCCLIEWILIIWGIGMNTPEGNRVRVTSEDLWSLKIWRYLDCYIAIYDSVKHDKTSVCSSVFQWSPTQAIKHSGDTFIRGIIMFHPSCISLLYHFDLTYTLLGKGRPHRESIFELARRKANRKLHMLSIAQHGW